MILWVKAFFTTMCWILVLVENSLILNFVSVHCTDHTRKKILKRLPVPAIKSNLFLTSAPTRILNPSWAWWVGSELRFDQHTTHTHTRQYLPPPPSTEIWQTVYIHKKKDDARGLIIFVQAIFIFSQTV